MPNAGNRLAERLADAMRDAGLSQRALADALGVRQATVSAWVTGKAWPGGDQLALLPELLGVDGHWLLTGQAQNARPEPTPPSAPDLARELDRIDAADVDERQRTLRLEALAAVLRGEAMRLEAAAAHARSNMGHPPPGIVRSR